jgi:diguanylate cyclase (GGDEF)-like protein
MHTEFFLVVLAVLSAAGVLLWVFVADQSRRFDEKYGSGSAVSPHAGDTNTEDKPTLRSEDFDALAKSDPLTGLLNRPAFLAAANETSRSELDAGGAVAIVVADIDQLKNLNDNYGHPAGDMVIRAVGEIVSANVHENEKAARFAGDEFVILLREFDENALRSRVEELRRAVELQKLIYQNQPLTVTVSCGTALVMDTDRDINDAIKRADRALYEAKSQGRNRVSVAEVSRTKAANYAA